MKKKVAIFHDFLIEKGGGERVVNLLSKIFKAPIVTWFYEKKLTYPELNKAKIFYHKSFLNRVVIRLSPLKLFRATFFFGNQLKNAAKIFNENFDVAIFSGFYSSFFAKFLIIPKIYYIQAESLSYVLERESYRKKISSKIYSLLLKFIFENLEKESLLSMNKIVANSNYTKKIYEDYLGIKIKDVVYPSINTKEFHFKEHGEFFLLVSRLYPHKRVQIVANVFSKLPNQKLIVVGSGPLSSYIRALARKYNNIVYRGRVSDKELKELYGRCKAVIYISEKEPFGLVPIEANASGKPAIVSNEGGLPETIVHGKTGLVINPPYAKNLAKVIQNFEDNNFDIKECIKNSKKFDEKRFKEKFKKIISSLAC